MKTLWWLNLVVVIAISLSACISVAEGTVSPLWSNLRIILEYGGMPAVILLFGLLYLRSTNKQWGKLVEGMQKQFQQQQELTLAALQNNTAALQVLSTKLAMGCYLFRPQTTPVLEAGESKPEANRGKETDGQSP